MIALEIRYIDKMLGLSLFWVTLALALDFNANSQSSLNKGTSLIIKGLLDYYPPASPDDSKRLGAPIGIFQSPYYWWEAGVAWGVLIDWQFVTGNDSYTDLIISALTTQAGTSGDFMPSNQSTTEGNDDQGFWGLAAMTAAERNFTNPPGTHHGWLYTAQAVFNDMKSRWDTSKCGGGLRWQIYTWNSGYDYKNTVSNGCFFNLAARLAHYTGNSAYADWAEKIFTWLLDVRFITTKGDSWMVYDGASMSDNCTSMTAIEWSYNSGLVLSGAAYMYSYTNGSSRWDERTKSLWKYASTKFFQSNVVYEASCQSFGSCNNDQRVFKGIFLQMLGQAASFLPDLRQNIMTNINASASAAAASCSGGRDGHTCGLNWISRSYDENFGLGEQISALSALVNTQIMGHAKPYSANTGGTSKGSEDASGSTGQRSLNPLADTTPITTADRAGAGVVTAVLMIFLISVGSWILV